MKSIVEAVHTNSHVNIVRLGLNETKMGDQGVKELLDFLKSNLTIADLGISKNGITPTGAEHINYLLQGNASITRFAIGQISDPKTITDQQIEEQDIFELVILKGLKSSAVIGLYGESDRADGKKLFFEVSKHHDVLQSKLKQLEQPEAQTFDYKQLFILFKQLQGRASDVVAAELSYCNMESDEFYMKKLAEVFKAKHDSLGEKTIMASTVEVEEVDSSIIRQASTDTSDVQAQESGLPSASAPSLDIFHPPLESDYYNALFNSGIMGCLDTSVDEL